MKGKGIWLVMLLLPFVVFAEPWRLEIRWLSGEYNGRLEFGTDPAGSNGYDDILDVPIPIPAPGDEPYAYFPLNDPRYPYFTMLERDIRSDQVDTVNFAIFFSGRQNMNFNWDSSRFPQGRFEFGIGFIPNPPASYEDMRTTRSITLVPGQALYIRYFPTVHRETNPPYFSNFVPGNGEYGVSVVSPISFNVYDLETGVDVTTIRAYLNGDELVPLNVTPIEYGYSVRYFHSEPFDANARYTLVVSASDLAYPPRTTTTSISFVTGISLSRAEWEFPLFAWSKTFTDSVVQPLSFGADPNASIGFDVSYDSPIPAIPPAVPYAYFPINDNRYPFITMLSRDIRDSREPAHIWRILVENSGENSGLVWFPDLIPSGWIFEMAKSVVGTTPAETSFFDMRSRNHIEFARNEMIFIRASQTPEIDWLPPLISEFEPPNGATNVLVTTSISCRITDSGSGVDRSSIRMWINGVDVSSRLLLTEIPYGYDVLYRPAEPLPFLSLITVVVSASDLSYFRNTAVDTIRFRTGSVLVPAWTETLHIYVTNERNDTVRMELVMGLDEYGTDGFDILLDAVLPPPPPFGPYAFFFVEDTVWNALGQDTRFIFDEEIEWKILLMNFPQSGRGYAWLKWESEDFTPDGNFIVTVWRNETIIGRANMRELDRIDLAGATHVTIRRFFGAMVYCINGQVVLGDAEHYDGTIIRILDTNFADTTDENGEFRICDIPGGIYTISIVHSGYYPALLENFVLVSDTTIYLRLEPIGYTVSGYITRESAPYGDYSGTLVKLGDRETRTNSSGYFIFENVQPGEYRFVASYEGYATFDTILVVRENLTLELELRRNRLTLCGIVLLEDDIPAEGAEIVLLYDGIDTAYADLDGRFCFYDLVPGYYILRINKPYYYSIVDTIELTTSTDRVYTLRRQKGSISGVCRLEGTENYSGVAVILNERDTLITDRSGRFNFRNLDIPGSYLLSFRKQGYFPLDTTVYLDVVSIEVNVLLMKFFPPRNLRAINGLSGRVPLQWDPPEESSLHPLKYRVYRAFPPFTSYELIAEMPFVCDAYIDRDVMNFYAYQYAVSVLYEEGESGYSNWVIGNPRPNAEHPEILVYDFDNGGNFIPGEVGAEHRIVRYLSNYGLLYTLTPQDAALDEYNLLEYELVIICTGVFDELNRRIRNEDLKKLTQYLLAGGRIYWEGADVGYTYYYQGDEVSRTFFGLFGVNFEFDGVSHVEGNVVSLFGNYDFFGWEINVGYAYRTMADQFIDELSADMAMEILYSQEFPAPSRSRLRAAAYSTDRYRTVISSVYLGGMLDGGFPNSASFIFGKILQFLLEGVTPINEKENLKPTQFDISLYPNPFNSELTISVDIPKDNEVSIEIFNVLGSRVYSATYGPLKSGNVLVKWCGVDNNGVSVPGGVYFVSVKAGSEKVVRKALLIK